MSAVVNVDSRVLAPLGEVAEWLWAIREDGRLPAWCRPRPLGAPCLPVTLCPPEPFPRQMGCPTAPGSTPASGPWRALEHLQLLLVLGCSILGGT